MRKNGTGQERRWHVDLRGGVRRGRDSPGSIVGGFMATAGLSPVSVKGKPHLAESEQR